MAWILDPIDGTVNYANGVPVWATLNCAHRGRPSRLRRGVGTPLGRRWWRRPAGAFAGARTAHPRLTHADPRDAYVSCTDIRDSAHPGGASEAFGPCSSVPGVVRAFGDFWSHMLVAEGVIDVARRGLGETRGMWPRARSSWSRREGASATSMGHADRLGERDHHQRPAPRRAGGPDGDGTGI